MFLMIFDSTLWFHELWLASALTWNFIDLGPDLFDFFDLFALKLYVVAFMLLLRYVFSLIALCPSLALCCCSMHSSHGSICLCTDTCICNLHCTLWLHSPHVCNFWPCCIWYTSYAYFVCYLVAYTSVSLSLHSFIMVCILMLFEYHWVFGIWSFFVLPDPSGVSVCTFDCCMLATCICDACFIYRVVFTVFIWFGHRL